MPMRSSYEAVAASYHVEDSEEELDLDYDDGLMSRRSPWSHPLIGESHQSFAMNAINSSDDEGNEISETYMLSACQFFQKRTVARGSRTGLFSSQIESNEFSEL